jgi:hypothetical protein
VVRLFAKDKGREVQTFMLKLVNENCPQLRGLMEGPRLESRVNLTVVVAVIPVEKGKPVLDQRFNAITKEFSTRGVALVLHECRAADELILGFRWERSMKFVLGQAQHLSPLGGGFWQLGLRLKEMVVPDDCPGLLDIRL